MALLGRILVVVFALFCASVAASAVLSVAILAREWSDILAPSWETGVLGVAIGVGAVWISGIALLPALAVIAVAEAFAWRSVLFYAGLGLALALWAHHGGAGLLAQEPDYARERDIAAAAGIVGGLTYWAVAGRKAGAWRRPLARPT